MNTIKKTFAQKYSTEFEKIVLEMVEGALQKDFEIIASSNTKEKSDGGYDGYCFIKSPYDETSTALLEAKLRTVVKDLPLNDFSKSVIIAINMDAACIIIGTNLYFSGNTIEQLETFIYNTGLEIRTLDYKDILEWLNKHPEKCECYQKSFVRKLREYAEKNYSTACRELSLFAKPPIIDKKINCLPIYGKERKEIKNHIISIIRTSFRTFVIEGKIGIGKKTLIENLLSELLSNNDSESSVRFVANKIDMGSITNQNDFIYTIISLLWGCNYNDTVDFFYGLSDLNLRNTLTKFLPEKTLDILNKLSCLYKSNIDIDVFFTYIADLYKKTFRRHKIQRVFYFYNFEYSKDIATNKLVITFVRKMSDALSIILSIPDNDILNEQKHGWTEFYNAVFESKNIVQYKLKEWERDTANKFIKDSSNDSEILQCSESIINYFGKTPACLVAGIDLINSDKMLLSYIKSGSLILNNSIDINKLKSAILYNIKKLSGIQCYILYVNLLIGVNVNNQFLSTVLNIDIKSLLKIVESIPYLVINQFFCQWKNILYLNLIKDIEDSLLTLTEKYELYNRIINNIDILETSQLKRDEVLLVIYVKLQNTYKIYELSKKLMHEYKSTEQYNSIFSLTTMLINSESFLKNICYDIYIRIEWLVSAYYIGINGDDTDFSEKFFILRDYIQSYQKNHVENSIEMNFMLGNFYYISSLIHLANSEYNEMKTDIKHGFEYLKEIQTEESLTLQSKLCANYAISLKHLINIESCVEYLSENEAVRFNPKIAKMPAYIISFHTNHASLYTGSDPQRALAEFIEINEICKNYSKESYLHNLHNIASMKFILKDYSGALETAEIVYRESYENNISIEFGRCQNLLGCLMWHENKISEAKYYFESSYKHFKKHRHNTHLWAPLVNLAILCGDIDDPDTYKYTLEASSFLFNNHMNQIKSAIIEEDNIPKIVVAVLMIMYNLDSLHPDSHEVQDLIESIERENIAYMYFNHVKGQPLKDLFINTAYNCDGKIMLKV